MTQEARDRRGLWLVVIFALGLGLRWSMMSLGPYHSDCLLLAVQSQKIILTGKMHYLQSSGLPLTALTGALFVAIFNAADDLDRAVRAVNTMSVVFGSLSIWLVYLCAARMRDKATALLAALFSALNPFLIGMATFGNSHVLALFFLIASLYFLQRYADSGRRLDLIWAGCTLGAAGAARIQDLVAMVIPVTLLMVWQRHRLSQRRDPVYFVLPWIIAVVMVVGAYLPKFVGGTDGEGGVDQLIQSHLLAYIDPMSVAGYVTMFQQLMGTFSPVEWVLMSSGLVILVAHREYRTVALLLIWILIPMFVFGQLAFFVYRFLLLTVVALLSAFYMALDPIATIASQKIWMDTMLAFLTVISIYWFSVGLFKNKNFYFILSGIASGLAINTKYTGYLATIAILIYTLLDQRELFKNKIFLFSLFLPLFMLVPWLVWNFNVYGMSSLNVQGAMHTGVGEILDVLAQKGHLLLLLAFIGLTTYHFTKKKLAHCERAQTDDEENENTTTSNKLGLLLGYIVVGLICLRLSPYIYHAFLLHSLPSHSWQIGYFHGQPPWFYCGRLIEFSFPYLFGILTLFTYQADRSDEKRLAVISVGTIMLFFICWGNYQSRYILPCLPLLLLLSLEVVVRIVKYLNEHSADLRWRILRIGFFFAWLLFFYHTTYINVKVSYPNDLCYF